MEDKQIDELYEKLRKRLKSDLNSEIEDLRDNQKAQLVEQEHRQLLIVKNAIDHWKPSEETSEEVSKASRKAFFTMIFKWLLFNRKVAIAGGSLGLLGGIIALVTLLINMRTLDEFRRQNNIVFEQNQELKKQSVQSTRSSNVNSLSQLLTDISKLESIESDPLIGIKVYTVAESLVPYQNPPLMFRKQEAEEWSNLFSIDTSRIVSPERGALFLAIYKKTEGFNFDLNPNFTYSFLSNADLADVEIIGANLNYSVMNFADVFGSDLTSIQLFGADLRYADFTDSDISNGDLRNSDLFLADLRWSDLDETSFNGAYLEGADLTESKNLNILELCKASSLYKTQLDSIVKVDVCRTCPEKLLKNTARNNREPEEFVDLDETDTCQ